MNIKLMKINHKIGFAIAAALAIASWIITVYYWDKLPNVIPTHFGFNGQVDGWANKSLFYVLMVPVLQSIMLVGFVFLYYKPQYSDMPTTLWLMSLEKKHRDHAFSLIRVMLVGTLIWISVLFTYITYSLNASALNKDLGVSPWIMSAIIISMIVWLIFWSIRVFKATKQAMRQIKQ